MVSHTESTSRFGGVHFHRLWVEDVCGTLNMQYYVKASQTYPPPDGTRKTYLTGF